MEVFIFSGYTIFNEMTIKQKRQETADEKLFREAIESITPRDIVKEGKAEGRIHEMGRRMMKEAERQGSTLSEEDVLLLMQNRESFDSTLKRYGNFEPRKNGPTVYLVLGVSGSGKSPSIRVARNLLGSRVEEINFGDEMQRLAFRDKSIRKHQLHSLPEREQEIFRRETARKVSHMCSDPDKIYLIETHATIYGKDGFLVSLSPEVFNVIRPNGMFMVSQDPELIIERREEHSLLDKKVHQRIDEVIIGRISKASGVSVYVVERNGLDEGRRSGGQMARIISSHR